jgi:hypothetical protein
MSFWSKREDVPHGTVWVQKHHTTLDQRMLIISVSDEGIWTSTTLYRWAEMPTIRWSREHNSELKPCTIE